MVDEVYVSDLNPERRKFILNYIAEKERDAYISGYKKARTHTVCKNMMMGDNHVYRNFRVPTADEAYSDWKYGDSTHGEKYRNPD